MAEEKIPTKGLARETLNGLLWMFSGTGVQAVLQILVLIILARLIAPEKFGIVSASLVIVSFSEIFTKLGVGPAVVQFSKLEERHIRTGFTIILIVGLVIAGAIVFFSPLIAFFFHMEELTVILRVISIVFPLRATAVIAESLLQREMKFRWLANIHVLSYAIGFGVIGVFLAVMGLGVWALVGANIAQTCLQSLTIIALKPHPKKMLLERRALRELLFFGTGFTLARIGNYVALQGDNLVVGRWLGAEALGLYGRAYHLMSGPATLFGHVLDKVLFPAMAKVQNDTDRLRSAYRKGITLISIIVLPLSSILIVLAPEIVNVFLGEAWAEVVVPFKIMALGMLFRTSYKMSDSLARATGAVYRRAWRQWCYALLVIIGAYFGQKQGINGVAVGVLVAITVNFSLMAHLSLSITSMTYLSFFLVHLPSFILSITVGLVAWVAANILRNVGFHAIAIIFITGVMALGTITVLFAFLYSYFLGEDGIWMIREIKNVFGYLQKNRKGFFGLHYRMRKKF